MSISSAFLLQWFSALHYNANNAGVLGVTCQQHTATEFNGSTFESEQSECLGPSSFLRKD